MEKYVFEIDNNWLDNFVYEVCLFLYIGHGLYYWPQQFGESWFALRSGGVI